ncbi:MAG: (Fe-S)-binding protein [Bacteroidales bacterium]|nr:(Fe-S)-binding protein [Bacteroidales bacterium]
MRERLLSGFDPFVLPFMIGMCFVLLYCLVAFVRLMGQLSRKERRRFFRSLFIPKNIARNVRDIFCDCLLHVKLWKRNPRLGYMHSSIAFGWFMIILLGHIETFLFVPHRAGLFYYPIFFRYFMVMEGTELKGSLLFFLMDFFLAVILSGIALAVYKRIHRAFFGMRRTTRLSLIDLIGLYSLWAIFPLRWIAEGFTANVAGGSFMTIPINWLLRSFMSNPENITAAWWAYSIALGTFMCVLPYSRYMHIPAEMILIPMRNAGLKVRAARRGFALVQIKSCPGCGVCIDACPMGLAGKKNSMDASAYLARQIRRNNQKNYRDIADKCLMCGKCKAVCQVQFDSISVRRLIREAVPYKLAHDYSYLSSYVESGAVSAENPVEVLYYAGCMSAQTPVIPRSVQRLLDTANISYKLMDPDGSICCGRPLILAGRSSQARELIRSNTRIIHSSGCKILIVSCPICYRMFREEYKLKGVQVLHYTEYFDMLIKEGRLAVRQGEERIAYHDPCELGRGCGIYNAPRRALSAAGSLVPVPKEKVESICCGGSLGSLTLSYQERSRIAVGSLKNLTANGPDLVVTACPLCLKTLADASDSTPVKDFAQVLCEHT